MGTLNSLIAQARPTMPCIHMLAQYNYELHFLLLRIDQSVSLLSKGLPNCDYTAQFSVGHFLFIQCSLINQEYELCWRRLSEIFNSFGRYIDDTNITANNLMDIFQMCFLGFNTALHLNKIHLAEYLGYRYVSMSVSIFHNLNSNHNNYVDVSMWEMLLNLHVAARI